MSSLTENDSTFPLPQSLIFFFSKIFPIDLKAFYISTGTFAGLGNPKGNLTPVKECASLLNAFMSAKFCVIETQLSALKQFNISKKDLPGSVTSYRYYYY